MKLRTIRHLDNKDKSIEKPIERLITSINGQPFYKSSGRNSKFEGTWFPFFGLCPDNSVSLFKKGWFMKPSSLTNNIPDQDTQKLRELFGFTELNIRLGSVPCMLISSLIGQGVWETEKGKALKTYLKEKYPTFYQSWPALELLTPDKTFTNENVEATNQWIYKLSEVTTLQELGKNYPIDLGKQNPPKAKGTADTPLTPEESIQNCNNEIELDKVIDSLFATNDKLFPHHDKASIKLRIKAAFLLGELQDVPHEHGLYRKVGEIVNRHLEEKIIKLRNKL